MCADRSNRFLISVQVWNISCSALTGIPLGPGLIWASPPRLLRQLLPWLRGTIRPRKLNRYWNIANNIFTSGVFSLSNADGSFHEYLKKWQPYTKYSRDPILIYTLHVCVCVARQFTLRRLTHFVVFSLWCEKADYPLHTRCKFRPWN